MSQTERINRRLSSIRKLFRENPELYPMFREVAEATLSVDPILAIDSYKLGHITQYPKGVKKVYSNLTVRSVKYLKSLFPTELPFYNDKVVVFGIQGAFQEIVEYFELNFFLKDKAEVINKFKSTIAPFLDASSDEDIVKAISDLHDLGYLPLIVKALPEGIQVPAQTTVITITNDESKGDFAWLPNYIETLTSSQTWKSMVAATIAKVYKNIFEYFAKLTGVPLEFTLYQGHDFSSRGLSGIIDAIRTGPSHMTSFMGSDDIAAIDYINRYYSEEDDAQGSLRACSVPATEHAVMTLHGMNEKEAYKYLLKEKYPKGICSIVSDTNDYWNIICNVAKELKEDIVTREPNNYGIAKAVFRPDSGDPVDIVVGTNKNYDLRVNVTNKLSPEEKGSTHCLYENFGGEINEKGYINLNQKIGGIYGDSITPNRAYSILKGLKNKGFSSSGWVFGIGSYTYQYVTRDSVGLSMKATFASFSDGTELIMGKNPKTDSGKKSYKGMIRVSKINGEYVTEDGLNSDEGGELRVIFKNGEFFNLQSFDDVRINLGTI